MTSLARWTALLLGAVLVACAWLPWAGASKALVIPIKTLWDPGYLVLTPPSYLTTIAIALWVAGGLVVLGALLDLRSLVAIGALGAVATTAAWILSNAVSTSASSVAMSNVRAGAYTAVVAGLLTLLLATLSRDTATPTVR